MNFNKILIVSRYFYPINNPRSFRTTELVKEFARQGHDVTLLTVKDDRYHLSFEQEYGIKIKNFGSLKWTELDISKGHRVFRAIKRIGRRALNLFLEYPNSELFFRVSEALRYEKGYDILISIATPHPVHWGVARAWKSDGSIAKTWIADCGDPFMGTKLDSFRKMFYFSYFEKDFCRKADYITVPVEKAVEGYYPEFHHKIRIIPQGFNFDEVNIVKNNYKLNEVATFGYAGSFIAGRRDPRPFLEYLLSSGKDFKFIVFSSHNFLIEQIRKKSPGKILLKDPIPRPDLLHELSKMDFLLNINNGIQMQTPSKLIDYYLTGRPVLSIDSNDFEKKIIDEFLSGNYSNKFQFKNVERYKIENVAEDFLGLYENH